MSAYGITPKAVIEGPPRRDVPILLRQTSFKALEESIRFAGDTQGRHTARFGEIEQRGVALTPDGRALYDRLLAAARPTSETPTTPIRRHSTISSKNFPTISIPCVAASWRTSATRRRANH